MAKVSSVEKNDTRRRKVAKYAAKRGALKATIMNRDLPMEERFDAQLKLNELPRDGSPSRVRNRCGISGRPRGNYRKFNLSRIAVRELGNFGQIPGLVKSSW
ncbi:MAG: 30S ribosomal protein S14 [Rickettsiales bacterium]|nr:30S ribosomal protein S14 [Rickettsiales bacterium]